MTDIVERLRAMASHGADEAAAEIERLRAERDALRADAERYRWLREHNASDGRIHLTYVGAAIKRATTPKGEMLDAAIDAAMANDLSK